MRSTYPEPDKKDAYESLGVERNADRIKIRKAFRKLALKYHPDKQMSAGEAEQEIAKQKVCT